MKIPAFIYEWLGWRGRSVPAAWLKGDERWQNFDGGVGEHFAEHDSMTTENVIGDYLFIGGKAYMTEGEKLTEVRLWK
jgi:hypothetical protein